MTQLAVLVPVLARPHRVIPFLKAMNVTVDATVLFIADPDDTEELDALEAEGAEFISPGGNYASKIRAGIDATTEPLIFTAADDLLPHGGWFETAKSYITDEIQVVGTNDLCTARVRSGEHSTHFLMTREYADLPCAGGAPGPFFQGYHHWYCDDELVATARMREALHIATDSVVEHLHPITQSAPDDETYIKGRSRSQEDRRTFRVRSHMWRHSARG